MQMETDTGVAAPAMTRLVVVLGMHRSGTSLCTNMLAEMGLDMAETAAPSPSNARGHWERARINDLNDRVFNAFGRGWKESAHALALPEHWLNDPRVANVRHELVTFLRHRVERGDFGFKDPRTARLLPLWRQVFAQLGAAPRFVVCVRDPAQVARSIGARDRLGRDQGEYRWLVYNADLVRGVGADPVCVVPYEDWFIRPAETAARLARFAGGAALSVERVNEIVDPSLRHDEVGQVPARTLGRRLHSQIVASLPMGRFSPDLLAYCEALGEFESMVQPLLVDMEVLRGSITDQNRVIADLNAALRAARKAREEV